MNQLLSRITTALISGTIFFGTYFLFPMIFNVLMLLILVFILVFEWPLLSRNNKWLWLITPIYPTLPILFLIYFTKFRDANILIPLYPFLIAWIYDTFAYFSGVYFGKNKLCPNLSPNKTYEGLFGGFIGVVLANFSFVFYYGYLCCKPHPGDQVLFHSFLLQSILITFAAFSGDLFISYLKRKAETKDVGVILPGHGGLLDRFDSVFFVVVILIAMIAR